MRRPNIVLLYTDQQRWDTINALGFPYMHTPHLDSLVKGGVGFNHYFVNSPVCMPSRQSFLSGLYPSATGCTDNGIELRESTPLISHYLKPYGYTTGNMGKFHGQNHSNRDHREAPKTFGFDTFILSDEPGCYDDAYIKWVAEQDPQAVQLCRCATPPISLMTKIDGPPRETHQPYTFEGPEELTHTAFVADQTVEFIRQNRDRPFLAIAGFYAPHTPVNPPPRFLEYYRDLSTLPPPQMNGNEEAQLGLSQEQWLRVRQHYYALISHIDDQIGRILDALREEGLTEETIILFTSDHGEHLGDHGLIQKGPLGYDSCSRVPLIINAPGRIDSRPVCDELLEGVDILPTILDFCGIQTPPHLPGQSLCPLLEDRERPSSQAAFMELKEPFGISWKTIRTKERRYAVNNKGEEFLFDLKSDPYELKNRANEAKYREIREEMRYLLIQKLFAAEPPEPRKTGAY